MEWKKQPQPAPVRPMIHPPGHLDDAGDAFGSNVAAAAAAGRVGLPPRFKIMTDEQVEVLRTQISAYATICEQLVEMHKAHTAQQDLAGVRLGNPYGDPVVTSVGNKISARQRWTPTPLQLHALEHFFDQGTGTPSKQKIKEITAELSQHGQISETNVYNWFQNRRARSKRKQLSTSSNHVESEVETDTEPPNEKKTKPENLQPQLHTVDGAEDRCQQGQEKSSEIHSLELQPGKVEPQTSHSLSHLSCYESMREHPSMDIKFNSSVK